MIEVYQIVRVSEIFRSSNGFSAERIERCFKAFKDDIDLGRFKVEDTTWLFLSEDSARDYCERHNTTLESALTAVGLNEMRFEFNVAIINTVYD